MTTAVDTNVIVALWNPDHNLNLAAQLGLEGAFQRGAVILCAPVLAELLAGPGRDETFIDAFLTDTGIVVDWTLDEQVWRAAGRAYRAYADRRRRQREREPRRILTDFVIGAHALLRGYQTAHSRRRRLSCCFPRTEDCEGLIPNPVECGTASYDPAHDRDPRPAVGDPWPGRGKCHRRGA